MENKATLRKNLKQQIDQLSAEEKTRQSEILCDRLRTDAMLQQAHHVGVYLALPDEPDLRPVLQEWHDAGKRLYLPIPNEAGSWAFHELHSLSGEACGPWKLEFPPVLEKANRMDLEAILVPGRGFTRKGHRIGRGKGIYDRLLEGVKARTLGIGFDVQLVTELPQEPTDIVLREVWVP